MKYNAQIHHRRSIRLKGYDYSQAGLYFITICTHDRKCLFGKITDGQMVLNDAGKIAYDEWMKTPELRKNIELDTFIVMPNHIHGIIAITGRGVLNTPDKTPDIMPNNTPDNTPNNMPDNGRGVLYTPDSPIYNVNSIGNQLGVFNTPDNIPDNGVFNTPDAYIQNDQMGVFNTPLRSPSQTVGAIVRGYKSSVTKQINASNVSPRNIWQRNYYEHIIRNAQSYHTISEYIIRNPSKWNNDKFFMK